MRDHETWIELAPDPDRTLVDPRSPSSRVGPEGILLAKNESASEHDELPLLRFAQRLAILRNPAVLVITIQGLLLLAVAAVAIVEHRRANQLSLDPCRSPGGCGRMHAASAPPPQRIAPGDVQVGVPVLFERRQAERQAAELIASNHYQDAQIEVELLQQEFPDHEVYDLFLLALRSKIRCSSRPLSESGGCN